MAEHKRGNNETGHENAPRFVTYALIILTGALIYLCVSFYREFSQLPRLQIPANRLGWIFPFRRRLPLAQSDVSMIQSWMTFDYINRVFNIPADYLRTALHVSDSAYPRIPLSRYAKNHAVDPAAFLDQVKNAVRARFAP
jgi:hypothetical protein